MDFWQALGLAALLATLFGVAAAIYYGKRSVSKEKLLIYESESAAFALVSAKSLEEYRLSVVFESADGGEERIEAAYVSFLRFINLGREPIRRTDIAPSNPLNVEARGERILDISLVASRREVTHIELGPLVQQERNATRSITFDFLDHLDGALIRVVATEPDVSLRLTGDIIGMPRGIKTASELHPSGLWGKIGGIGIGLLFLSAFALVPFVYRWVTGSWSDVWVLALPALALFVPMLLSGMVLATIWPNYEISYPPELAVPPSLVRLLRLSRGIPLEPGDRLELYEEMHRSGDPPRE